MSFVSALKLVFAADTLSIIVMEITDNAVMVTIPGLYCLQFAHTLPRLNDRFLSR